MTRIKNGVSVKRERTYPNRWGNGRTHLATYREAGIWATRGTKRWLPVCQSTPFHSEPLPDDDPSPVTCRNCLATPYVPDDWRPA